MPFGLVFPSFPALVLAIGLFGKIMAAGTGTKLDNNAGRGYFDPRFKRLLWYLISSTRGGVNRVITNNSHQNATHCTRIIFVCFKSLR
jgi:hypothetical protein